MIRSNYVISHVGQKGDEPSPPRVRRHPPAAVGDEEAASYGVDHAQADDPYKVAALDSISTERLYRLGLSRHDLFRFHVLTHDALERRLNPVI